MPRTDRVLAQRYNRRYRYAIAHDIPRGPMGQPVGIPMGVAYSPLWDLPAHTEAPTPVYTMPAMEIPGPALACCGAFHAVTQTPFTCPCCDRRYLEGTA